MKERNLNHHIQKALIGLDPIRVENAVGIGSPDINYTGGWIESKWLRAWPKRRETKVRIDHYVPEQRAWHVKRRAAGGVVYVVLQVDDELLVYDAAVAAQGLGFWTRDEMYRYALLVIESHNMKGFREFILTNVLTKAFKRL